MFACGRPPSGSLPPGYCSTEQLPAQLLLFEPCAVKLGLLWGLFLTRSSSGAGFSGVTERREELGPQQHLSQSPCEEYFWTLAFLVP